LQIADDSWRGVQDAHTFLAGGMQTALVSHGAATRRQKVPTIAYFLGISVAMYYRDHNPPHIHVIYQGL
jgi:hypothetical protein